MSQGFHIGDALIRVREERNLTQGQLSALAGIRPNTLSDIERNRKDSNLTTLEKVVGALGMTVPSLYQKLDELRGVEKQESTNSSRQSGSPCPDADPTHEQFHALLEKVLHSGDLRCIHAVVAVLEVASSDDYPSSDSLPSDKKHGPFPPIAKPTRKHA